MHYTIRIVAILTLAGFVPHALAQSTYWLNEGEDDWHEAANWSAGVPTIGTYTYINNGGEAHVSLTGCAARGLYVGQDIDNSGAIRISAGRLETDYGIPVFGDEGTATITHTGGDFIANSRIELGRAATGQGSYYLSGGTLRVPDEYVGTYGPATFEQTGGTHEVLGLLTHAYGGTAAPTYTLSYGDLTANEEVLGRDGTARMIQTGGTHTVTTDFYLGRGSSSLDNEYDLQAGEVTVGTEYIGYARAAVFNQSGGTHTVTTSLWMGSRSWESYPDCRATYHLTGGTLDIQQHLVLANGARNILFEQTGGTATVVSTLFVGNSGPAYSQGNGIYSLGGGSLEVGNLEVARNGAHGHLRLRSPDAYFQVNGSITFYQQTYLQAAPGVAIHLPGPEAVFHNEVREESNLEPLRNVELVFEGGDTGIATFEVGCVDYGATLAGYHDNNGNMALGTLTLGGADVGRLQFVNAYSNQSGSVEALYVNTLNAGPGAYLDLNEFNLYYMHGQIDATAIVVGGTPTRLLAGDYDENGVVDLADYPALPDCAAGPDAGVAADCWVFDFDTDGDVDIDDFAGFQRAVGGS